MTNSAHTGQEDYPEYDALWHLRTIGVLNAASERPDFEPCDRDRPTRVAVIDTSVAQEHPNLSPAINTELALDLFSTRLGAFPYYKPEDRLGDLRLNAGTQVAEGLTHSSRILADLIDRMTHGGRPRMGTIRPATGPEFSVHGTAIAGLVGGRPCQVDGVKGPMVLPYAGVDPTCEIVPISTNFDPDPEQMIIAFLYAELIDADVVLLPRIVPDPIRTQPELSGHTVNGIDLASAIAPNPIDPTEAELWGELAELIVAVSLRRPVVCAAGNANEEFAIYPANLATEHNGIISVGALNSKGYRSGYSDARNATVMAPSNDSEVFDNTEVRLDEQDRDYDRVGVPEQNSNFKFSAFQIVSTDVPGRFGYAGSPFEDELSDNTLREFGSYFCLFGGTSASSAIVAGFLALGRSAGALGHDADGLVCKNWLLSKCQTVVEDDLQHLLPVWSGTPHFPNSETSELDA